jgi:hypothetical protein
LREGSVSAASTQVRECPVTGGLSFASRRCSPGGAHRFEFDSCRTTIRAGARRIPVLISIHAVNVYNSRHE